MLMKTSAALTLARALRSDVRDLECRRRQRRGTVQPHPDREREAGIDRLAADQSRSPRRRDLRARMASAARHRGVRVTHEHQGGREARRAREHVSGEQVLREHLSDGVLRRRRRPADANARSAAGNRRADTTGRRRAISMECNWKVGFSLEIPKDWLSGVYLGKLSTLPVSTGQYLDLEMAARATSSSSSATIARPTCCSRRPT